MVNIGCPKIYTITHVFLKTFGVPGLKRKLNENARSLPQLIIYMDLIDRLCIWNTLIFLIVYPFYVIFKPIYPAGSIGDCIVLKTQRLENVFFLMCQK